MRASKLWKVISRLRNVQEGFIEAQISRFDVNFHIPSEGIHIFKV